MSEIGLECFFTDITGITLIITFIGLVIYGIYKKKIVL